MKTCHKCKTRLEVTHREHGSGRHSRFVTHYSCMQGHTGTFSGQVGTDKTQWVKKGEIWAPQARVDVPDDYDGGDMG